MIELWMSFAGWAGVMASCPSHSTDPLRSRGSRRRPIWPPRGPYEPVEPGAHPWRHPDRRDRRRGFDRRSGARCLAELCLVLCRWGQRAGLGDSGEAAGFGQSRGHLGGGLGVRIGRLSHDPNHTVLGDWAGGPAVLLLPCQPPSGGLMQHMALIERAINTLMSSRALAIRDLPHRAGGGSAHWSRAVRPGRGRGETLPQQGGSWPSRAPSRLCRSGRRAAAATPSARPRCPAGVPAPWPPPAHQRISEVSRWPGSVMPTRAERPRHRLPMPYFNRRSFGND